MMDRTCKIVDNKLRLSLGKGVIRDFGKRFMWLDLPSNLQGKRIKQVHIIPKLNGKYLEIAYVYETDIKAIDQSTNNILAIDLGQNNFASVITNGTSFLIDGMGIKSYNRWYNKERARLQSIYAKQNIKSGTKMKKDLSKKG